MDENEYRTFRESGLNEVYSWMETYDRNVYARVHPPRTHKADYDYRMQVFDRALKAGIKRYGMGVLFGLGSWEFDVLSLLDHALYLSSSYGIPPYAFGIPRLKKAPGIAEQKPWLRISNRQYRLAVAIYRLAFPATHTYMNTRENLSLLLQLLRGGGSEINAEATTRPGGYTENWIHDGDQFFHYSYNSQEVTKILEANGMKVSFDGKD
jgi:2-iminoacetate synthase